ncbi:hypothetical protein WICPIJ_006316 [Wickerhamomyces pijperi]|uniref:RecQ mediated genome instability protein 1 OB-fold domain-containing protein n=1 Tax=Wickerhamomyces pijperi TaxID=599730 RepID=A0A9P8Q3X8_WICPI|nr:hypothetical protein WICPIJ_006316 [Wickerhamomyces pijperi]
MSTTLTQQSFLFTDITKPPLNFKNHPKSDRAKLASQFSAPNSHSNTSKITHETLFQVVWVENISMSKAVILDELKVLNGGSENSGVGADRLRFGNKRATSGAQPNPADRVIRDVVIDDEDQQQDGGNKDHHQVGNSGIQSSKCFYKLTLQDSQKNLIYAIEMEKLPFLSGAVSLTGWPIHLGSKLLLKEGTDIIKGVIMLRRNDVEFIGGSVRDWNTGLEERIIKIMEDEIKNIQ